MKLIKKLLFLATLFFVLFSCSKNDSKDDSEVVKESKMMRYSNTPNVANQLLAEAYIKQDDATTYVYGTTDAIGNIKSVESLSFKETNSDEVYYFILDDFQRVKQIYSEVNGVKSAVVQLFYYLQEGLVNYVVAERNWATKKDKVIHFSTVEINGENVNYNTLLGKSLKVKGITWDVIVSNLIVVGTVAAAAVSIAVIAKGVGVIAAVSAGVLFVGAAFADEPPVANINPSTPKTPETILLENQCTDSNLAVTIGVDPGNELYALVGGNGSGYYNFYWSTGEKDLHVISSHITAPDDGTYYVLVEDDESGCVAFGSKSISSNSYEELIIGTWKEIGFTTNGVNEFDDSDCDIIVIFTETQMFSTEYYGDNPGECNNSSTSTSSYSIVGNMITEIIDRDTDKIEILELNETTLIVKETEPNYTFVQTFSRQ